MCTAAASRAAIIITAACELSRCPFCSRVVHAYQPSLKRATAAPWGSCYHYSSLLIVTLPKLPIEPLRCQGAPVIVHVAAVSPEQQLSHRRLQIVVSCARSAGSPSWTERPLVARFARRAIASVIDFVARARRRLDHLQRERAISVRSLVRLVVSG